MRNVSGAKAVHASVIIIQIIEQNLNQFLFVVKATALKQQTSEFYPQIQRTDASDHIYVSQWPECKS